MVRGDLSGTAVLVARWALTALVVYAALVALAWAFQTRLIYPAPRSYVPVSAGFAEVRLRTADGLTLRAFERAARPGLPTVMLTMAMAGAWRVL